MRLENLLLSAIALSFLLLTGCSDDDDDDDNGGTTSTPGNVVEVAQDNGLSTLVSAASAAELDDDLATLDPITVFAPTDAAFDQLGTTNLNDLTTTDTATLAQVLLYHVVSGDLSASDVIADSDTGLTASNAQGDTILVDQLSDGSVWVNQAQVTTPNVDASNGTVHVIDSVLLPQADTASVALAATGTTLEATDQSFDTLVSLISQLPADSESAVFAAINSGDNTIFAPVDSAFDSATVSFYQGLTTAEKVELLSYHIYSTGAVKASQAYALDGSSITMANGEDLPIVVTNDLLTVGGANLGIFNLPVRDGTIIHAIDTVLVPPSLAPLSSN